MKYTVFTSWVTVLFLGAALSLPTLLLQGCADYGHSRRNQVLSKKASSTPGGLNLTAGPCPSPIPNINPVWDWSLDGSDYYVGCFASSGQGNFYVSGHSSFSDRVVIYPIQDNGGNQVSFLAPGSNSACSVLCQAMTVSDEGSFVQIAIDSSSQSFNTVAIVPEEYAAEFEAWAISATNPTEPPYSIGAVQ